MPDTTLPRWARIIGRSLRSSAGLLAVLFGVGDLLSPSPVVTAAAGPELVRAWSLVCILAGLVAFLAVIAHRWRWEMVACSLLALAVAAKASAVWLSIDGWSRVGAAAGLTLAVLLFLLRTVDLMVFAAKTAQSVRLLRRWDAE